MNFLDLAKQRSSVRKFKTDKVEDEKLLQILESGRVAPTAANCQPQRILVLNKEKDIKKLEGAVGYHDAPLVLLVCADKNTAWVRPFDGKTMTDIDATIVADHMVMEAESLGLSSCWLTYFKQDAIKDTLNIPDNYELVAILSIGYSTSSKLSVERHNQTRLPLEQLVTYGSF